MVKMFSNIIYLGLLFNISTKCCVNPKIYHFCSQICTKNTNLPYYSSLVSQLSKNIPPFINSTMTCPYQVQSHMAVKYTSQQHTLLLSFFVHIFQSEGGSLGNSCFGSFPLSSMCYGVLLHLMIFESIIFGSTPPIIMFSQWTPLFGKSQKTSLMYIRQQSVKYWEDASVLVKPNYFSTNMKF